MTRIQIAPRAPRRPRQIGAVTLSALLALAPMAALAQDTDGGASPPGESTATSTEGTDTAPAAPAGGEGSGDGADTAAQGADSASPTGAAETPPASDAAAPPEPDATEPDATEPTGADAPSATPEAGAAATTTGTAAPAAEAATDSAPTTGTARSATAQMMGAGGETFGTVTVAETASGQIHLSFTLENLPEGTRAIHIHETGSCEPPGFDSAGGHLTGGRDHGAQAPGGMHAGDLPNITIGADGSYQGEVLTDNVTMDEVLDSDGSAIVIHADADDYVSQPSGNAGDRIACGVLEGS